MEHVEASRPKKKKKKRRGFPAERKAAYPELEEEPEPVAAQAQARRLAERERGAATGWALGPREGSTGDEDRGKRRRRREVAGTAAAAAEAAMVAGTSTSAAKQPSVSAPGWKEKRARRG